MKLIPDWRQSWRLWSVRVQAAGATLMTFAAAWPSGAKDIWESIPADIRAMLPQRTALVIAAVLFIGGLAARHVQQGSKHDG